ncbi:MAG: TetR/AcrR family transcriptional regulator [Pseudomonadota bacterium]
MRPDKQAARRREIEDAAYEVLAEKGYRGASMLAIARQAGASNETLYRWYGTKQGLFRALVEENARRVGARLQNALDTGADPLDTLAGLGAELLALLLGDRAVALNRAAAADADDTGSLGQALREAGRDSVMPLIAAVFDQASRSGRLALENPSEAAEVYLGLLVGDLQIRRVTGALTSLGPEEAVRRADRAVRMIRHLYAADGSKS